MENMEEKSTAMEITEGQSAASRAWIEKINRILNLMSEEHLRLSYIFLLNML